MLVWMVARGVWMPVWVVDVGSWINTDNTIQQKTPLKRSLLG